MNMNASNNNSLISHPNITLGSSIFDRSDMNTSNGQSASFREQKKSYEMKKKCFTKNIHSALETTHEVHSGWLKARTTFKRWTRVWCQVKPGYLIMYTSQEALKKHRLGVVLLSICQAIPRPTKKEGYCFKLLNPFGCSVWAKSSTKAITFSYSSLTLRASDKSIAKVWLDSLQRCNLSANLDGIQCGNILDDSFDTTNLLNNLNQTASGDDSDDGDSSTRQLTGLLLSNSTSQTNSLSSFNQLSSNSNNNNNNNNNARNPSNGLKMLPPNSDTTNGCTGQIMINNNNDSNLCATSHRIRHTMENFVDKQNLHNMNNSKMVAKMSKYNWKELQLERVSYVEETSEDLGSAGMQSEEVHESNKSIIWHIIKQVKPNMDLSRVTLPTFILEPRSFLEKLADYYYHCDILSEATLVDDPVMRLIHIVKWYISGFYKKPSGPRKPYNPILGEKFRCFWDHPKTQSRTFFVAEQVSHHPPISAFHVTNRKDGYSIVCALLSRSRFTGNSVSAIIDGRAKLYLNKRDETYTMTMPYANCRGILLGSLCLELGGKVEIECAQTGCRCELDFKLAPVWANANSYNTLTGKIYKGNKITHLLEGHWDKKITILDKINDKKSTLWEVNDAIRNSRLKRYTVSLRDQGERESAKLWSKVTEALKVDDQIIATTEKTKLEDMQRREALDQSSGPRYELFQQSNGINEWQYKWIDNRPWNECQDIMQFENQFKIQTLMMTNVQSGTYNPSIDMPMTKLTSLSDEMETLNNQASEENQLGKPKAPSRSRGQQNNNISNTELNKATSSLCHSIQSKYDADNRLMKQAIEQVVQKNRKLEQDLAGLRYGKRARFAILSIGLIIFAIALLIKYYS